MKYKNKKGYYQIDFVIAFLLFVVILLFLINIINSQRKIFEKNNFIIDEKFNAKDICNLLINFNGIPNNWNTQINNLKVVGLSNNNGINLSWSKVSMINPNYYSKITKFFDKRFSYNIKIINLSNMKLITELTNMNNINPNYFENYNCFSILNNSLVEIDVEVFR